jgi:hypothetical protein
MRKSPLSLEPIDFNPLVNLDFFGIEDVSKQLVKAIPESLMRA